ncbi:hypothetical protein AKJ09_08331 [Labilithrix luteola]|uniref:PrsW family intramembrane metalloprotease n=1 Tax=Labilithrix luteola TaxID=1391654 RepID=A0A0K1Q7E8_9BACT|nr:PrsW family glutamic-type intramembrane protease [Labilithrix luteola]AKV01668.1 hypothetical protein AKJ09_08331 [Labilithrix luteola]
MRRSRLLYTHRGEPRVVLPALVALAVTLLVGFAVVRASRKAPTAEARAKAMAHEGDFGAAEAACIGLLRERPSIPLVLELVNIHGMARQIDELRERLPDPSKLPSLSKGSRAMSDEALDAFLVHDLPPEVSLAGRYWLGVARHNVPDDVLVAIEQGASHEPPLPWHNRLLARALPPDKAEDAATYFEREGLAFADHAEDVSAAIAIWIRLAAWDQVRTRLADPRIAERTDPELKYQLAVHDRDWRSAARWLAIASKPKPSRASLVLAATAALAWMVFCFRLGKMGERPRFKLPMYLVAFVLGVVSVVPTMLLIAVEEATLRLVETGDAARDVIYFVFGVGLREEASKLLLFLPLLPVLRKWGNKLDVLVCGALVGLGFAAEENLGYLASGNLQTGLGRFLTANFFHMAMTGILATALDDFLADRERYASDFSRVSVMVVALHGAYDFLLSHDEFGGGYMAMAVFVFLAKLFLDAVDVARRRVDRGVSILQTFVLALAIVTGVGFVYAASLVGPAHAAVAMGGGLLGEAIIVFVFVRTLRTM